MAIWWGGLFAIFWGAFVLHLAVGGGDFALGLDGVGLVVSAFFLGAHLAHLWHVYEP
jgi:hypothetical protein